MSPDNRKNPLSRPLAAAWATIGRLAASRPQAPLEAARAQALLLGYDRHWQASPWRLAQLAAPFHQPLTNPASGRCSRTFTLAGRPGGVISAGEGACYLLEHKTTSEDLDDPAGDYWARLAIDAQTAAYLLAQCKSGGDLAGVAYDILRRPEIRPRLVPPGSSKKSPEENRGTLLEIASGTYFGEPWDEAESAAERAVALERNEGRETPALFRRRLAADIASRPEWYFHRRLVALDARELARQAEELWQVAAEVRLARRTGRHYRNSGACLAQHVPCEFLALCTGHDSPESEHWRRRDNVHPELGDALAGCDSRQALTPSRTQCFQLCRRKHFFRYELGLARVATAESEALFFGRLIHAALAAWWTCRWEENQ